MGVVENRAVESGVFAIERGARDKRGENGKENKARDFFSVIFGCGAILLFFFGL